MHASCVHAQPASALLRPAALRPCAHPFLRAAHGAAWKAWAQLTATPLGAAVSALNSTWTVPSAPQADEGQTLFFWNGVEPGDASAVLQPVLQWGASAAGGGDTWAYASWYVSAAHGSHFSPLVQVAPGEAVLGTSASSAAGVWSISASAPGRAPSVLNFAPAPGAPWATAYVVLEAYGVASDCSLYPAEGAVNFTGVALGVGGRGVQGPLAWQALAQGAGCSEHAVASAAGDAVQIRFDTA